MTLGRFGRSLLFLRCSYLLRQWKDQPDSANFSASNVFRQGAADASEAQTALKHVYSTFLRVSEPQYVPLLCQESKEGPIYLTFTDFKMLNILNNCLVAPLAPPEIISGLENVLVAIFSFSESSRSPLFARTEHSFGRDVGVPHIQLLK